MKIERTIQKNIEKRLFKGKVIIIYGARQVGKTTLVKEILKKYSENSMYLNCEEPDVQENLTKKTSTELKKYLEQNKLVVFDEAQKIENIGLTLKLLVDNYPEIQIIATGSSSFDLSNKVVEPLTGRNYEFMLHPLSLQELSQEFSLIETKRLLENRMIYGLYPGVVFSEGDTKAKIKKLASDYSYKDIFLYQGIRNPEVLQKILKALALQLGNEVSYNEIAQLVGTDKNTVANYIQLLEQAFVIFRLQPLSRNLRNELKKMRKIYFYDTGVRNALINNFNPLDLRNDAGALWENFMLSERMKYNGNNEHDKLTYFWRTMQKQEIDYIEEEGGRMDGFEFKWKKDKFRKPKAFLEAYPGSDVMLVNKDNFEGFVGL